MILNIRYLQEFITRSRCTNSGWKTYSVNKRRLLIREWTRTLVTRDDAALSNFFIIISYILLLCSCDTHVLFLLFNFVCALCVQRRSHVLLNIHIYIYYVCVYHTQCMCAYLWLRTSNRCCWWSVAVNEIASCCCVSATCWIIAGSSWALAQVSLTQNYKSSIHFILQRAATKWKKYKNKNTKNNRYRGVLT